MHSCMCAMMCACVHTDARSFVPSPTHSLGAPGTQTCTMQVDLWHLWVPSIPAVMGLRHAAMVEDHSATKFTVGITVNTPWPISTRDMMVAVQGVDCMDPSEADPNADPPQRRQVVVLLNSTDTHWSGAPAPPPSSGVTRMDLSVGALILTPSCINGGGTGTHLAIISRIDPKLHFIPDWLISTSSRLVMWQSFLN